MAKYNVALDGVPVLVEVECDAIAVTDAGSLLVLVGGRAVRGWADGVWSSFERVD